MEIGDLFVLEYDVSEEDHGIIGVFSSEELASFGQQICALSGNFPKLYISHFRLNDIVSIVDKYFVSTLALKD